MPDRAATPNRTDCQILGILQKNARATLAEIAEAAHLSVSQTQRRLKRLEEKGVIVGYAARVDAAAVGLEVEAYAEVTLKKQDTGSVQRFHSAVQEIPEIIECHRVSGDADYLLRVVAPDLKGYSRLAQTTIVAIPEVDRLRSLIVFESFKNTTEIPLTYATRT